MTPEEKRRRRLEELAKKIRSDSPASITRLVGWGCLRWGCRGERVSEYLSVLAMAGKIELNIEEDSAAWIA